MASLDLIQNLLASLPGSSLVADKRQILMRCHICGDSPNPANAHFYIGPLKDESKPLQFDCKKCGAYGLFDGEALRNIGIYDYTLIGQVNEYNKTIFDSSVGGTYNLSKAVYTLNNSFVTDDNISLAKLGYINERLGTNLTLNDCLANKIVLNLKDLLIANNIQKITRHPDIIEQLNRYFIGFVSYDNCYINMRRLCKDGKVYKTIDKRYINYNIFDKIDNSMRFYIPPASINLLSPEPVHIYATEGPFDILSVKYNISIGNNCIYISAGGKSYLSAIKFVIGHLGIINAIIHLCPDGDVDDYQMYNINNYLAPFNLPTDMLRNAAPGQKDFGVPLPSIKLLVQTLN